MLLEKLVMSAATDMIRHEIKSRFLRPSDESASVPRIRPPIRHPMKKDEAGRPVMNELAHSRDHSDMVVFEAGPFHAQAELGSAQVEEVGLHVVELVVQCHAGWASVQTLMNDWCPSQTQANDTTMDWKSCAELNAPRLCSIILLRDGRFFVLGLRFSGSEKLDGGGGDVGSSMCLVLMDACREKQNSRIAIGMGFLRIYP
ncbi:hypothetical protein GBA52_013394 [Prunus armeniaca]|nr:hypothetical protein GBA52_013394 [Prunus armeniaca]